MNQTSNYILFLTVLTPLYVANITAGLISKGYLIKPAATDDISVTTTPQLLSSLISLRLYTNNSEINEVYNDITALLDKEHVLCYSIVLVSGAGTAARFNVGNITVDSKVPEPKKAN